MLGVHTIQYNTIQIICGHFVFLLNQKTFITRALAKISNPKLLGLIVKNNYREIDVISSN